jgi:methyltransferase (TIGR00027 family)
MRELAGARLFEIDHPATQAVKRAHLRSLPPAIADVTFVPVNFEQQSVGKALAAVGHDGSRPTCWIWEGVVMYLTPDAMRATLADVGSRSAPDSTLIINYHTSLRRGLFGLFLRMLGEPVRSAWSPAQMAAELRSRRFDVVEDSGVADWAQRYATGNVEMRAGRIMRIAVARRASR